MLCVFLLMDKVCLIEAMDIHWVSLLVNSQFSQLVDYGGHCFNKELL